VQAHPVRSPVSARPNTIAGRVCAGVTAALVALWAAGPCFLNAAFASTGGCASVRLIDGRIEVSLSDVASFQVMTTPFPGGRERLSTDLGNLHDRTTYVLGVDGQPRHAAVVWFPQGGTWSLAPSVSRWSAHTTYRVPYWCIAVPFAAVAFISERRRRAWLTHERLGKCAKCGYSRAGLAVSTCCPECGTPGPPDC
jgi:hypothetical protein